MKRIFLSILLVGLGVNASIAQIGDLKNKLKEAKGGNEAPAISDEEFWTISPKSQQELSKLFLDKFENEKWTQYEFVNGDASLTKTNFTTFFRNSTKENGQLKSFEVVACPLSYSFMPNNSVGSFYAIERDCSNYTTKKKHPEYIVMFGDNFFVYASSILQNADSKEVSVYEYSNIVIVTGNSYSDKLSSLSKNKDLQDVLKKLNTIYIQLYQNAEKSLNDAVAKKEEERRIKYSIKDKKVKTIDVKLSSTSYKQGDPVSFEIIANLEDGSQISTKNGGFLDDYSITLSGFSKREGKTGEGIPYTNFIADSDKLIPNDEIGIKVNSKYHPNLKAEAKAKADYNTEWTFAREGSATTKKAASGADIRFEVKKIKVNGVDCYEMKVYYWGKLEDHVRQFKPVVTISVSGIDGTNPKGQDGGDGGNVEIIRDPSATDFKVVVYNDGGSGSTIYQQNGKKGKLTDITQKLNW